MNDHDREEVRRDLYKRKPEWPWIVTIALEAASAAALWCIFLKLILK